MKPFFISQDFLAKKILNHAYFSKHSKWDVTKEIIKSDFVLNDCKFWKFREIIVINVWNLE